MAALTHPLRFKPPHLPKRGEFCFFGDIEKPVYVKNILETKNGFVCVDTQGDLYHESALNRRYFSGIECATAQAVPPVEGAMMLLRNGEVTEPITKFGASDFQCRETMTLFKPDGRGFTHDEIHDKTRDIIAVHTWPEVGQREDANHG